VNAAGEVPANDAVHWEGTRFGLLPRLAEAATGSGLLPAADLLAALGNADRYVAAHVLLTLQTGVRYATFPDWNGLQVEILPDGRAQIDPGQRDLLARRWERYFRSEPRPDVLPEI
jgi:hypothetical protein